MSAESLRDGAGSGIYAERQFGDNYPEGYGGYYWLWARNELVRRALERHGGRDQLVLDVGCGRGLTVAHLVEHGIDCLGVEPGNPEVAATLRERVRTGCEMTDLEEPLRRRVRSLTLLDVLEHVDDPASLLGRCVRSFPAFERLVVTVPASPEIWSNYDHHYGHRRRYRLDELVALVSGSGLVVVEAGYAFHCLYLAARLMLGLRRQREVLQVTPRPRWLHRLVAGALIAETSLVPGSWKGSSILAVARPVGA